MSRSPGLRRAYAVLTALLALASCAEPTGPRVELAKAAAGTVTVTGVEPGASARNVTLDVQILGSGFDRGSTAAFELGGVIDPRVKVNRTTYVSGSQLTANLTVAADAVPARYDVRVTTGGGKKGIGTERFEVLIEVVDLGPLGVGTPWGLSSTGIVVGGLNLTANAPTTPFVWQPGMTGLAPMQSEPTWEYSWGEDVNAQGDAVGVAKTPTGGRAVLWRAGTGWSYELLPSLPGFAAPSMQAFDINDAGDIVGNITDPAVVASGPVVWRAGVPSLLGRPAGFDARANGYATGINDLGWVLARASLGGYVRGYLWIPNSPGSVTGTYLVLPLSGSSNTTIVSGLSDYDATAGKVYVSGNAGLRSPAVRWAITVPVGRPPAASDVVVEVLAGGEGTSWGIDRTGVAGGFQIKGRGASPNATLWKPDRVDLPPAIASGVLESAVYDVEIVDGQRWAVGVVEKESGAYRATLWKMRP